MNREEFEKRFNAIESSIRERYEDSIKFLYDNKETYYYMLCLQDELEGQEVRAYYDYTYINVGDTDEAWSIVERIVNDLNLEDGAVRKEFEAHLSEPTWYWNIKIGTYTVTVYKAEPDIDCTPKRVKEERQVWVCEK